MGKNCVVPVALRILLLGMDFCLWVQSRAEVEVKLTDLSDVEKVCHFYCKKGHVKADL